MLLRDYTNVEGLLPTPGVASQLVNLENVIIDDKDVQLVSIIILMGYSSTAVRL